MTTSDIDIFRTSILWVAHHGEAAVAQARKMAAKFQRAGDRDDPSSDGSNGS